METVQLNIKLGYQINTHRLRTSFEQARNLLLTKKQRKYTRAYWNEEGVELVSNFIECPHCGHRVYAYARDINKAFDKQLHQDCRLDKQTIVDWTTPQMKIFEDGLKKLEINRVVHINSDVTCPACKNTIHFSQNTRQVQIIHHRHKIQIRMEILDIKELFSMPCMAKQEIMVRFPLYEVACFNFKNGHSYLKLENSEGECLAVRDYTFDKHRWSEGVIYDTIAKNKYVKRAIRNAFALEWGGGIPFFSSELCVNELRMLTMFVGYDRSFYSCIPFAKDTLEIDESFRTNAKQMRYAHNVISLYKNSELPKKPSAKRLFFENAGLFFYIDESVRLWKILGNIDYFVDLFSEKEIYQLLSDLHTRTGMFDFLEDYAATGNINNLFKFLNTHWRTIRKYAINYSSMSKTVRMGEHDKWKKHEICGSITKMPDFAIPMCDTGERIRNCTIDEFEFSWLKTSNDYAEAGKALNNCLTDWNIYNHPVVCVRRNGKIIAAMEIRNNFVFQAYTSNNESLSKVPGLFEAYIKWHAKNNLSQQYLPEDENDDFYDPIDEFDDWGLPF